MEDDPWSRRHVYGSIGHRASTPFFAGSSFSASLSFLAWVAFSATPIWQAQRRGSLHARGTSHRDLKDRVKASPNDAELRVRLGEALATAGLLDDAIQQFGSRSSGSGSHGRLSRSRHHRDAEEAAQDRRGLLQQGRRAHERTAEMENVNQRRETAFFYLGEIALDAKRYEDAVANFKASLRIRRDAPTPTTCSRRPFKGMDRPDAALEQLDAALAFDPNYAEAHYLMGEIYLEDGDKINAAVHFRIAADKAPDQDLPQEALASLGTADEAIARRAGVPCRRARRKAIDEALLARALDPKSVDAALFHAAAVRSRDTSAAVGVPGGTRAFAKNAAAKAALAKLQPKKKN